METSDKTRQTSYEYPPVTEELFDEVVGRILEAGDPLKVVLFGSRAWGAPRPDSDLDLLIIEDSGRTRRDLTVAYRLALLGSFPAKDVIVRTPQEIEAQRSVRGTLIQEALDEGKVLYAREV